MHPPKRVLLFALIGCLLLAACDVPVASNSLGGTAAPATLPDAVETARQFLTAWTQGDYPKMYGLTSPRTQIMTPDVFYGYYTDVDSKLQVQPNEGKAFDLLDDQSLRQGNTAVIRYNMVFDTASLGKFRDDNRTLRLILTQQGAGQVWRVAWSTMDIFEGMAGGAALVREFLLPKRGTIYDRNGQVLAEDGVTNYAVRLLTANGNPVSCYQALNAAVRLNVPEAQKRYDPERGQLNGYTIGTFSEADRNKYQTELQNAGCSLQYREQISRFYYGNGVASQVVGYVGPIPADEADNYAGYPPGASVGLGGIERRYEKELAGDPGAQLVIRTPEGLTVRTLASKAPGMAQDITLTIDRDFQLKVDDILANAYSEANWGPLSPGAAAVVLNVQTGEVLAMGNYPMVNPDAFPLTTSWDAQEAISNYVKKRAFTNRVVENTYAPASTFKIVSMAAAMETLGLDGKPLFNENTPFTCDAVYKDPEGLTRFDWIYSAQDPTNPDFTHGRINLRQALTASCDDYFWHIGEEMYNAEQADALKIFANRMGLGVKTGIDLPGEAIGVIPNPDLKLQSEGSRWGVGDTLNIVIGQGNTQITPLQEARMLMGIANGGTLYKPYVVRSVGKSGEAPSYVAPKQDNPQLLGFEKTDLNALRAALCAVPRDEKYGTAYGRFRGFPLDKVSLCGKTGTAQKAQGEPPSAWFVSYVGQAGKQAEIAVVVYMEKSREGSEVSAPITRRIIEAYYGLNYYAWPDFWYGPYIPVANPGE